MTGTYSNSRSPSEILRRENLELNPCNNCGETPTVKCKAVSIDPIRYEFGIEHECKSIEYMKDRAAVIHLWNKDNV